MVNIWLEKILIVKEVQNNVPLEWSKEKLEKLHFGGASGFESDIALVRLAEAVPLNADNASESNAMPVHCSVSSLEWLNTKNTMTLII